MSSIPVELPDHLIQFVDRGTKDGGFNSRSEFIASLVAAANAKQNEIEQKLMAGIASGPARPWTDDEWQAIKKPVVSKNAS